MRVLFVVSDRPLSSTAPGGSGTVFAGLLALLRARDDQLTILILKAVDQPARYEQWRTYDPAAAADLDSWAESIEFLEFRHPPQPGFLLRKVMGLLDPQRRAYPFLGSDISEQVSDAAHRTAPDLVIAADLPAGLASSRAPLGAPLVYYHHDAFWRIRQLREGGPDGRWRSKWGWRVLRKAEERLVGGVDACITGSVVEAASLHAMGGKRVTLVPPVVIGGVRQVPASPPQPCRIVHLGGLETTATRLGLERFLDVVWPVVRRHVASAELWVVGDTSAADAEIIKHLDEAGAVVTGFVPDLTSVLQPGDLHVIPWEQATGIRTRVISCFQNGQALVAVKDSLSGYEGLENRRHCVLVDSLEDLVRPLVDLALDPEARVRLARGGQLYLENNLTLGAVLPRFESLVGELTMGCACRSGCGLRCG